MLIQRMSAAFGRLRNETLQLQDGLNIIEAPNETGKSTWCAFLTAMLYGINSRERDKAGFIADKNRYAPWDGGSMSGRLECHADGADLTLTRTTRRQTTPMADFQAVYTGTASPVDGLTGTNCGETLLGVSREVFERSAFIRQSGLAITQDAGLERRVASLISSGDEDTSYTEAYDALKKQLNRRRFNKSGQLPALEAELAEVQQQLDSSVQLQQQLADALERSQALESDVQALSDELAQYDRWESAQKRRQLAALTTDADTAAQRVHSLTQQLEEDRVPDTETIGRLRGAIVNLETVRKNVEKARTDRDEAMKALLRAEKNVNDSPFAGQEGKFVTSRQLRDRLMRELLRDVSLRVTETDSTDAFRVAGRGEMHLSILIENMRREGYELGVSTPRVLFHEVDGKRYEPIEELSIDVPEDCVGSVMEKLGSRKAELQDMHPQGSRTRLTFLIPSRGLFGYKSEFLTDTKGEGIMSSVFYEYAPYKGEIPRRSTGSLISFETGEAVTYGLFNAQERGSLFIGAGVPVYEGMVVGASPKAEDLVVNVCKRKHLTNTRASGSDDALRLVPPRNLSLEDCLEFLADDELLEVTPKSLRIRKQILSNQQRAKMRGKK